MSNAAAVLDNARASQEAIAARLAREVGTLAGRLADLIRDAVDLKAGPAGEAHTFLRGMHDATANGSLQAPVDHPIDRLALKLELTAMEVNLLVLAGMPEQHEGLAAVLRTLHPRGESRPTAGLAAQMLCGNGVERFHVRATLESGALVTSGALRVGPDAPFFDRSLEPAESLWSALHGIEAWPPAVPHRAAICAAAGLEDWLANPQVARAVRAIAEGVPCTIVVTADAEERALERALALVAEAGRQAAPIACPGPVTAEVERLVRLHCLVRDRVPVVQLAYPDGPGFPQAPSFRGYPGPALVCGRTGGVSISANGRAVIGAAVLPLPLSARQRMWRTTLPELSADAALLASRYPVEPAMASEVAEDARCFERLERRPVEVEDVGASVRARSSFALSGGVKLIRPTAGWKDLVLPEPRLRQLTEAVDRLALQSCVLDDWGFLRGRPGARGVRMLLAGPPGTGKTLSAEVMAAALSMDLLLVDISRVVSKWIGETEKNLAQVFDAAERAQAVLFFDEADALFGKRTEVSDAHDRYANLETAYLLSRLERFDGLAVLATNLRQNIDPAFLRRLEFVVDYTEPGPEDRCRLWRCHLPAAAPVAADLNVDELAARYPVVGSFIRNAAVSAAFLAAAEGVSISRAHCIRAIRREYEKSGRAFPGAPPGMQLVD
jgi:hypothetical protein